MNTPAAPISHRCIEALESRIAPATLLFIEGDGDHVTVKTTKGADADLMAAATLVADGTGFHLSALNLTAPIFKGTGLSILVDAGGAGDGEVNVGFLNAAGIDLGAVKIGGELDQINAGDSNSATLAIKSLTVDKFGGTADLDSVVIGGIKTFTVLGDFQSAHLRVRGSDSDSATPLTDVQGKISTLTINGSLLGTARNDGGYIETTGDITTLTIKGFVKGYIDPMNGGTAADNELYSGSILSRGKIQTITVGTAAAAGGLIGGDGERSGQIASAAGVGKVTITGDIVGGAGVESGSVGSAGNVGNVTLNGDLLGGGGLRSGDLLSGGSIGAVTVTGKIQGGAGENSGAIGAVGNITSVFVTGDLIGGSGPSSGQIVSQGKIGNVTVQNLIGGGDFEAGAIGSLKGLGNILVKGDIVAGMGTRSGVIATAEAQKIEEVDTTPAPNAPIASVTVLGSILGSGIRRAQIVPDPTPGVGAGSIISSGQLGPVKISGDLIGGSTQQTGWISSQQGITSVTIGGVVQGGDGFSSGAILATGTIGSVAIGDPTFSGFNDGENGISFDGTGILGGQGTHSGSVIATQIGRIDVYGELAGGTGYESGVIFAQDQSLVPREGQPVPTNAKLGPVLIRGGLFGGDQTQNGESYGSGAIFSRGAIASVVIGGPLGPDSGIVGGTQDYGARIYSVGDIGPVTVSGSIEGSDGNSTASIYSYGKIASVSVGGEVRGGDGSGSGSIYAGGTLGPVAIGVSGEQNNGDLVGGSASGAGAVTSGGKITSVNIFGSIIGGDAPNTGQISGGELGAIFVAHSLIGGTGADTDTDSGSILSDGKIASVTIGDPSLNDQSGNVYGGNAEGTGSIRSGGDMGPVKIKASLAAGAGDNSGRIFSGGKLTSLTIGGSLVGGPGNEVTVVDDAMQTGQVFAAGVIGSVAITGDVMAPPDQSLEDGGSYAAQIHGLSITKTVIGGAIRGGDGTSSAGLLAEQNIGTVVVESILGGDGSGSGYIAAKGNITSVKVLGSVSGGADSGAPFVAAGDTLNSFEANFLSGGGDVSRPRISAGKVINTVTIHEMIADADILAGYDIDGSELTSEATIGKVVVGTGTADASSYGVNIVAGISPGLDGLFGTFDDAPIGSMSDNPALSKIVSVIFKNSIANSGSLQNYGIIAQNLVAVKVAGVPLSLHANVVDIYAPVSTNSQVIFGESPGPA